MTRLLDGETVDFEGRFFRARRARLYVENGRRPPVFMSAFNEQAAEVAPRARRDRRVPPRRGAGRPRAGRDRLQTLASWAPTDDAALEGSREWEGTLVDAHYTDPIADPAEVGRNGEEQISDAQLQATAIVSSDPDAHVKKLKLLERLGATTVVVMNVSGADPRGAIRAYDEHVLLLPALRG